MPLWRGDRLASGTVDLVCVYVCMRTSVSFKKIHDDHTKVLMISCHYRSKGWKTG